MHAEALIGTVLGGYTLERVLGQGTMGAVYLAQQSHPQRQVAVKVFLRATSLEVLHQIEFLERFHKEIGLPASLEHPHIACLYDYGDYDGMAYLVMPYIVGETLEDLLAREKQLSLPDTLNYLEQIAAALDYAHGHRVIHRDLKPANILITPGKRVLVTDFHLTQLLVEGSTAPMRLSRPGMLDYMAPEQVLGKQLDGRADLYSLGAILFHMVTGTPPFQGQTLMKVAAKHLKTPPPSPRLLRPDLPVAAEQAILAALAKKPDERYASAGDLLLVFRQAISAPLQLPPAPLPEVLTNTTPDPPAASPQQETGHISRLFAPGTLFGPAWRTGSLTAVQQDQPSHQSTDAASSLPNTGDFSSTGALRFKARYVARQNTSASMPVASQGSGPLMSTGTASLPPGDKTTHPLSVRSEQDTGVTGPVRLTSPVKIVSIPVAGKPGHFVTGVLPVLPGVPAKTDQATALPAQAKRATPALAKKIGFVLALLLVLAASLTFWRLHSTGQPSSNTGVYHTVLSTSNRNATATANALATRQANIILDDPLSQNIRNWPVSTSGRALYQFKDGAYHITNNDPHDVAPALLPGESLNPPFIYSLTMEEIRGDDTSINNEFGMILYFSAQQKNGKQVVTFYTFEVLNKKAGEYQFWKYDNSQATTNPWKELQHRSFGSEFHQGQGPKSINTFAVRANGKTFTLIVNGKQVWTVQDSSLSSGGVGMLVNLYGTEVAFSNLLLTYN